MDHSDPVGRAIRNRSLPDPLDAWDVADLVGASLMIEFHVNQCISR
jgi:hypothetical protein